MSVVIDRTKAPSNRSIDNRRRFIKRHLEFIKQTLKEKISDKKIKGLVGTTEIILPVNDLVEPSFVYSSEFPVNNLIVPTKKDLIPGDIIEVPPQLKGQGKGNSPGENQFEELVINLDKKEFMDLIFEGWELPNRIKLSCIGDDNLKYERAGYSIAGSPSNLNIKQTMVNSIGRRIALQKQYKEKIEELSKIVPNDEKEINYYKSKLNNILYIDEIDLRYNYRELKPQPIAKAVVFFLMDVSASVGAYQRELSHKFFYLLHLFLTSQYDKVDVVFIRHTDTAEEVGIKDFFDATLSGSTCLIPALELTRDIIKDRYPTDQWNIYIVETTDGELLDETSEEVYNFIVNDLFPLCQYFIYTEVVGLGDRYIAEENGLSALHNYLYEINEDHKLAIGNLSDVNEIYPWCKALFDNEGDY